MIYLPADALSALRAWDEKTRELERERGSIIRHVFHRHGRPITEFPYSVWHAACAAAKSPKGVLPTTSAVPPPGATAGAASRRAW